MRTKMTVGRLIMILEGFDEDSPVTLAHQPRRPLEFSIGNVAETSKGVIIGEGRQIGYLSGEAAEDLGWK